MTVGVDYEYEISTALGKVLSQKNTWSNMEEELIKKHYDAIIFMLKALKSQQRDVWLAAGKSTREAYDKDIDYLSEFTFWVREALELIEHINAKSTIKKLVAEDKVDVVQAMARSANIRKFTEQFMNVLIRKSAHHKFITEMVKDEALEDELLVRKLAHNMVNDNGEATVEFWYESVLFDWDWGKGLKDYLAEAVFPVLRGLGEYREDD